MITHAHRRYVLLVALSVLIALPTIAALASFSLNHEHHSHALLIPVVSVCLLFRRKDEIFRVVHPSPMSNAIGIALFLTASAVYQLSGQIRLGVSDDDRLSIRVLSLVAVWIAGFIFLYGTRAFRAALFPLLLLLFLVPIPSPAVEVVVALLQHGSAEATHLLFRAVGVPALRDGFTFVLPAFTVEIAKECSGIRSSLGLLITSLIASHLVLRGVWRRSIFSLAIIPVVVLKNAVRIVTLSLLAMHIDAGFLTGTLHRRGGVVFFVFSLLLLLPLLWILARSEERSLGPVGGGRIVPEKQPEIWGLAPRLLQRGKIR